MTQALRSSRDVILRTSHWEQAVRHYESLAGFNLVHRSETLAGFDTGAFVLYVEKGEPHGPVFELLTSDVQAKKTELLAAGCVVIEEDPALPRCYLRDPFGLVFNLGTRDSGVDAEQPNP